MINIDIFSGLSCALSCFSFRNVDQGALLLCKGIWKTITQDKCSYGFAHAHNDDVINIRIWKTFNIITTAWIYYTFLFIVILFYFQNANVKQITKKSMTIGETIKPWFFSKKNSN